MIGEISDIANILLLVFLAFIPVWSGGQAMKCYDAGELWRSVIGVLIAVSLNTGFWMFAFYAGRYNWSSVTILSYLFP